MSGYSKVLKQTTLQWVNVLHGTTEIPMLKYWQSKTCMLLQLEPIHIRVFIFVIINWTFCWSILTTFYRLTSFLDLLLFVFQFGNVLTRYDKIIETNTVFHRGLYFLYAKCCVSTTSNVFADKCAFRRQCCVFRNDQIFCFVSTIVIDLISVCFVVMLP